MNREILTKDHKFWRGFMVRLNDMLVNYNCQHNFKHTEKILKSLPNISVEDTLEYFQERGGYCDCEIFFNVGDIKELKDLKHSGY